jgi:hypothetical protein
LHRERKKYQKRREIEKRAEREREEKLLAASSMAVRVSY